MRPDPARSGVSCCPVDATSTEQARATVTLQGAGRTWRGGSGACLALSLLFLPSYLTVVQVWVEVWGWVGVGGCGPSHYPPCAGLGLAGGVTPQHHPHQEMWSKPSSSSSGSPWSSAVSHHELVSCTMGQ